MQPLKLFMLLLGCKPAGRYTEQHDIFFSIGTSLKAIVPDIIDSWPGAGTIHIDAWREITEVDGFQINILSKEEKSKTADQLFFLNLGGYKPGEFEEYHYKMLVISKEKSEAVKRAKETAFYKHTGFKGAESHIDDKYGIDVDDIYEIQDILPKHIKKQYCLQITAADGLKKDEWQLGYTILSKLVD
ncbi:MAG: DUF1543 domain-containing protein [Ferruginibacter sp.]